MTTQYGSAPFYGIEGYVRKSLKSGVSEMNSGKLYSLMWLAMELNLDKGISNPL